MPIERAHERGRSDDRGRAHAACTTVIAQQAGRAIFAFRHPAGHALAGAFYQLSLNILLEKATENLQAITAKNNELVESQLKRIDEAALMLTVDQELHSLMNPALPPGNLEILHGSREIKRILDRYFIGISGIFACHMYTVVI